MGTRKNSGVRFNGTYYALGCTDVLFRFLPRSGAPIRVSVYDAELGEVEDWDDFVRSLNDDLAIDGTRH